MQSMREDRRTQLARILAEQQLAGLEYQESHGRSQMGDVRRADEEQLRLMNQVRADPREQPIQSSYNPLELLIPGSWGAALGALPRQAIGQAIGRAAGGKAGAAAGRGASAMADDAAGAADDLAKTSTGAKTSDGFDDLSSASLPKKGEPVQWEPRMRQTAELPPGVASRGITRGDEARAVRDAIVRTRTRNQNSIIARSSKNVDDMADVPPMPAEGPMQLDKLGRLILSGTKQAESGAKTVAQRAATPPAKTVAGRRRPVPPPPAP